MENREEIVREARSQMAREAVEARWARLDEEGRREAVRPANEARRMSAAMKRRQRKEAMEVGMLVKRWRALIQ
jgi:hypothetical protein